MRVLEDLEDFYYLMHPLRVFILVSKDGRGRVNFMTVAWAIPASSDPPMVAAAISKECYTLKALRETGEFVLAIPTVEQLGKVWKAGTLSGFKVDKSGIFKTRKALKVKVPIIEECIANIECKVRRMIDCGETMLVIGDVIAASYDEKAYDEKLRVQLYKAKILSHLQGKLFLLYEAKTYKPT